MNCSICNKEFTHRGAMNLHEYHCKFKRLKESAEHKIVVKSAEPIIECEHSFRFLNSHDQIEKLAIQNGYSEVCVKCQSLQV